jgi:hypothetical protein
MRQSLTVSFLCDSSKVPNPDQYVQMRETGTLELSRLVIVTAKVADETDAERGSCDLGLDAIQDVML